MDGFKEFLGELVSERRRKPGDPATDVLTRLLRGLDGQGLGELELLHNCIFILNAGHETTTNLIANALELLALNESEKKCLAQRPDHIATAIDEFLRFQSPNQLGNRITTCPVEFHGQRLETGTSIHLCIGAANRDPRQFHQPDRLDITRKPNRHLAFAGGPHLCAGFSLARMEGRIAIERFQARFPDYRLLDGARRTGRIRFRGFETLPATLA